MHAPWDEQSTVVDVAVLETLPPHECAPEQPTAQAFPLHAMSAPQVLSVTHRTSHDEEASQPIIPAHALAPLHVTLQSLPLHSILPAQEPVPAQLIWQELAFVQSIDELHEPAPRQSTTQGMPGGQTTETSHAPGAEQPTMHVPSGLHVPRPASAHDRGQSAAASTASPSELPPSPGASASPLVPPSLPPSSGGAGAAALALLPPN